MDTTSSSTISRRLFLVGSGGVLLAACGSDRDAESTTGAGGDDTSALPDAETSGDDFALIRYFNDPSVVAGEDRRLAVGLADVDGTLSPDGPDEISAVLLDEQGESIVSLTGTRRTEAVALPYYEFRFDVPTPAIYTLRVMADDGSADASFSVVEPGSLPFAGPGDTLEPFDTPTVDDLRGVDPICTREPSCPFHDVTLTDALATGRPVVYLIGTPAFCQTATCGPILDLLMDVAGDFEDITFVHSEVYIDTTATTTAPAVEASGLTFEPAIFLVGADGVVVERLDVVVDTTELRDRIERLTT
ncbi:MAG: hypothetical protein ABJH68_21470 [Ilumatobacter sp.]|uniref:hypothetical protein n=1 Tax=Ilumatobacter sp. TaxID=1967498 RepID=UPI00329770AC